jgi:hypothetical protein
MKKIGLLLIGIIFVIFSGCLGSSMGVSQVVDNSPYPEFIYVDKDVMSMVISEKADKEIPSFAFAFIDGAYINKNDKQQIAIKTPLWMVAGLYSKEGISAEEGYIFMNSQYIGKPDPKFKDLLPDYNDVVVYVKEGAICVKVDQEYTLIGAVVEDNSIPTEYKESILGMLNGLKSIGNKKVMSSQFIKKDGLIIGNITMEPITVDDITNINYDINYVPIEVKVDGWNRKDQNTYTKGYNYMIVYKLPVNKEAIKNIIEKQQLKEQNIKKLKDTTYNDWDVGVYRNNFGKIYICSKELEYGSVCIITNDLKNLDDVEVFEKQ